MFQTALFLLLTLVADPESPLDFDTQIIPVLTRAGCNAGACHGAAAGRGGFHLSMLGADPEADYAAIVHEYEGRRVNLVKPAESLVLKKPTEELSHEGGSALDEMAYERMLAWILQGARRSSTKRLAELSVQPDRVACEDCSAPISLQCMASFSDGTTIDVTPWVTIVSSDKSAITVDGQARLFVHRPGQHVAIVRFLDQVLPVQVSVPYSTSELNLDEQPRTNFIDDHSLESLRVLRIPPSPPAADSDWHRRVRLDLTGRLPTIEQSQRYMLDSSLNKREILVDELLDSEGYVDYWTLRFSTLLRMHSLPNEPEAFIAYSQWLRSEIATGTGLDEVARALLMATGDSHVVGPANFARMVSDARSHAELVGQVFLGAQLGCANCHNHPLDRWTQDDFHGLAAIFAKFDRSREVKVTSAGSVSNPRTGELAIPRIPGDRYLDPNEDHRNEVVKWVLDQQELPFAQAMVNRVWQAMFGRGLVEPIDDLKQTSPATHPELLKELTKTFAAQGYSLRKLLRSIALSQTYSRSHETSDTNLHDDRFYSHALIRPLSPQVYADAIADVTDVAERYEEHGVERAVRVIDSSRSAEGLDILGRCRRPGGCSEQVLGARSGLASGLHLLNGAIINRKLSVGNGRLKKMIDAGSGNDEIINAFYWAAFARSSTDSELALWMKKLSNSHDTSRQRLLEDFVWGLLNSDSFRNNR